MEYVRVGKYVNTHGLKGEIKIISSFKPKETIYAPGKTLYFGQNKKAFIIMSYRPHQQYDMVTLEGLNTIEDVLPLKGNEVYVKRDELEIGTIAEDVMDFDVYNNNTHMGKVIGIIKGITYDFIVVGDSQTIVPFIDNFIVKIDNEQKIININYVF